MQKLLSRPLSNPKHSFSYFFSHSVSKTTYDPPFSPISKPPKPKPKPPDPTPNRNPTPIKSSLPFDFRHSHSETDPTLEPIGFREPKRFSPFGPGRLDREWTGTSAPVRDEVDSCLVEEERIRVLGDPLTAEEIEELVEKYRHSDCARQINLGMTNIGLSVASKMTEYLVLPANRHLSYVFRFAGNVEDRRQETEKLIVTHGCLENDNNEAVNQSEEIEENVEDWHTEPNKVLEDVKILETEIDENKRRFNWCPNFCWHYQLSKKEAKKKLIVLGFRS
ncbi:CRS2-associated factor 2, mitochondrial [Gossypium australe]|uniref:CRS2-associated factor 2, mitochondrial n=1 Tax=Gossypium australe TaxID=47621 RepID=A0A5B6U509_9ROSI|nr:CRS2-associated factor 2, mitochondrial [Gossypium australe]